MVKDPLANAQDIRDAGSVPRKIPSRRAWQPTPVFLPGESPRTEEPGGLPVHRVTESDTTERPERTHMHACV